MPRQETAGSPAGKNPAFFLSWLFEGPKQRGKRRESAAVNGVLQRSAEPADDQQLVADQKLIGCRRPLLGATLCQPCFTFV